MNRTRKSLPRTFKMEPTGPKVPSRYLTGPTSSCHDHCKCAPPKETTETKPIIPSPKRVPKPPADRRHIDAPNSVPRTNKPPSVTPKITTRNSKNNNNVVKDQTLKIDVVIEPKKRDFKLKSVNSQAKTNNQASSRTPRRRMSDNFVPNKDMSLQPSRFPKRRLSEIVIHPNTDGGSVSNGSMVRGSGINKNESRKDSKLPLVSKKSIYVKTTVSTSKRNVKVSPLRTNKSPQKPDQLKGSRKSKSVKPVEEFVLEETLHVNEPNNDLEITKSQSKKSLDRSPSSFEVKAMKDDQNGVVESSPPPIEDEQNEVVESLPPPMEDDTFAKDEHNEVVESLQPSMEYDTFAKDEQIEVVESLLPSMEDDTFLEDGQPLSFEMKAMKDDQNGEVESLSPSVEDDTLAKDEQNGEVESSPPSMEDDTLAKYDQNGEMESSPPSMEDDTLEKDEVEAMKDDQNGLLESLPSSMEDDTLAKDVQQNENISDSEDNDTKDTAHVETLVVETNDSSLDDLKFRRGTILSPESEKNSLIELQFTKGKELEKETEEGEHISLRRLSSDGVVYVSESVSISVDLKHQEMEEKKAAVLVNNVIEEAASKLIQTRKSKVKALVGAFETIVSGETPRS
ncbi:hypothetical protein L1987_51709 [Smallanthus sonchifolius]|uniref:Uncharacterized protein n=1 Tax=Smallanthus sonchifolius TaxID=185202 RepID=A0ACB9ER48_9ASTR|nr:hypothetical protein L1987_51709 [Smallanthus sonchifolius]